MKQEITQLMPVAIGLDLDEVEQVEFLFRQGDVSRLVLWPGEEATRRTEEDVIDILWTPEESRQFSTARKTYLDTRITVKDSVYNPETQVVAFTFAPTLFQKEVGA